MAGSFGLQFGMSQTDWFGLGTGVLGTGYAAAAYNQAAYLGSVAMRQAQLYQKKNYHLGWVSVARDDIRDMMNISVTRTANYMMVATLILGVASDALLGVQFPDNCPDFVQAAFWISMALAILFFTESIMFSVKGQNSALTNTMRLLCWELRPENPAVYDHDYMQQANAFENSGLSQLFRIPGLQSKFEDKDQQGDHHQGKRGKMGKIDENNANEGSPGGVSTRFKGLWNPRGRNDGSAGSSNDGADPHGRHDGHGGKVEPQPALEEVVPQTAMLLYLARFSHYMQLWEPYDTGSKYGIGAGLISLAHGCAYFCLGHLATSRLYMSNFIAWVSIAIFVFITISVYRQNFHAKNPIRAGLLYAVFALSPVFGIIGTVASTEAARTYVAPLLFLTQALQYLGGWVVSLFEFKKPWQITKKYTTGPKGQQFPDEWMELYEEIDPGAECLEEETAEGTGDVNKPSARERRKVLETSNRVLGTVRCTLLFASLVWLAAFITSIITGVESLSLSVYRAMNEVNLLPAEQVVLRTPVPNLAFRSLACAQGQMFAANRYQVYSIDLADGRPEVLPCDLEQQIADVSVVCEGGSCRPLALLLDGSSVVDCATAETTTLLQGVEASRFTLLDSSATGTMLALSGTTIIALDWSPEQKGWAPQYNVSDWDAEGAVSVSSAAGALVQFGVQEPTEGNGFIYRNSVTVRQPSEYDVLGDWRLEENKYTTVCGCAMDHNTTYAVQMGDSARLLRMHL
mmetsp:Transcript_33791/g.102090  ORF Transcript_33791/g.102090 Transcript_33791/m.102090 type:complete len:743 (-) Transcript_33791:1-2229(-)